MKLKNKQLLFFYRRPIPLIAALIFLFLLLFNILAGCSSRMPMARVFSGFDVEESPLSFSLENYVSDADGDILSFNTIPPSNSETVFSTLMGGTIEYISDYNFIYTKPDADIMADYAVYKMSDNLSESQIEILTFIISENFSNNRF